MIGRGGQLVGGDLGGAVFPPSALGTVATAHELPSYGLRRPWDYFVRWLGRAEPPPEFKVKSAAELLQAELVGQ